MFVLRYWTQEPASGDTMELWQRSQISQNSKQGLAHVSSQPFFPIKQFSNVDLESCVTTYNSQPCSLPISYNLSVPVAALQLLLLQRRQSSSSNLHMAKNYLYTLRLSG